MLPFLKNYLLKNKKIVSVTIELTDSKPIFHVLKAQVLKGEIKITSQFSTTNIAEIEPTKKETQPVLLNFSGKGVINKKIDTVTNYKKTLLFGKDPKDFIFDEYTYNKQLYVSLIRNTIVNEWLKAFKTQGLLPLKLTIGPYNVFDIKDVLNTSKIPTVCNTLVIGEAATIELLPKLNNEVIAVEDEQIQDTQILNLNNCIQWTSSANETAHLTNITKENIENHIQKLFFDQFSKLSLLVLFLFITIGFLVNKNLQENLQKKQDILSSKEYTFQQIKVLEKNIGDKTAIIGNTLQNNILYSHYTFDISNAIPKEITLELIEINPIYKKIRPSKKIHINTQEICIEGTTINKNVFNNWLITLKKIKWVKEISIINYDYDTFRINLKL